MHDNRQQPTVQEIDGIFIDLNQITRREFRQFTKALEVIEDDFERDELTGEIVAKVVTAWLFDNPVTKDGYLDLGLADAKRVDAALIQAMNSIGEKKLEQPSTLPENMASP